MLKNGTFAIRVQSLRDSWIERRQTGCLANAHDFDSQFRLLAVIHGWAVSAVEDVQAVYADGVAVTVGPFPERTEATPGFSIVVDSRHSLTVSLMERPRAGADRWHLRVWVSAAGAGTASGQAGPSRLDGQWTRARLEELILSLLGAYERSQSTEQNEPPPPVAPRRAPQVRRSA